MYNPTPVPFELKALIEYLNRELPRLAVELNKSLDQQMVVYHAMPEKPTYGLYYADGSDWNPGSGRGIYRYDTISDTFTFVFIG